MRRDRHRLYEQAVQQPQLMVGFIEHLADADRGDRMVLREDFCGTALLAATWVRSADHRRAIGIDINRSVLRIAEKQHRRPLGSAAARLRLVERDVLTCRATAHVIASLNFSHLIYKTRPQLLRYFRHARRCLRPGGFFISDLYGGPDAQQPGTDRRACDGFVYVWEQAGFDPRTAQVTNHIHFELPDGAAMKRAFTYHWRLWTLAEVCELLAKAGFGPIDVYYEVDDGFAGDVDTASLDAWVAYIVARTDC